MAITPTDKPDPRKPLRLWPGVTAAVVLILVRFVVPMAVPAAVFFGLIGGLVAALAIVVWWVFFSRAPWPERVGAIVLMALALLVASRLVHVSIATGMMGMMLFIYAIPTLSLALVGWAGTTCRLPDRPRRAAMVAAMLLGSGVWTLVRTNGVIGGGSDLAWRWTETAEERLLARASDEPAALPPPSAPAEIAKEPIASEASDSAAYPAASDTAARPATTAAARINRAPSAAATMRAEWPGFRGPDRDGVARGVRLTTDWSASPPVEVWRRPIGPGWSSFAVSGDLLYTQEQRGNDEIVACYRLSTGEPVWRHRDPVRFWESNGGAGPRATPTLSGDRVYTFGATGIVNALNASTGSLLWSRNAASDTDRKVPDWGFASSPLVVDDIIIVAVSGSLVGYDATSGQPRWFGPAHGGSYSSPQRSTIDGVAQVLLLSGAGATSVAPSNGELLWEYEWPGSAIVQPALTADGDIVINSIAGTGGVGTRRLAVTHGTGGWRVEARWTSTGLKPYFNDFVVHKGHAFGFDGSILACIDLEDGTRAWKGGRYGNGQLLLLPDQDLLLVLSEEGDVALVAAIPDRFTEVARFHAIEGKTWNHPALIGDILLIRNGQEMVAFRLPLSVPETARSPAPAVRQGY